MRIKLGVALNTEQIAAGIDFLDSIISSTCCDLDATISASYGGSGQTWANLIASPADGSAQTGYDFHLGIDDSSSTDDPTFSGSAGDAAAFFSHDGGDWFTLKNIANAITIKNNHRTDQAGVWMAVALRGAGITTGSLTYFGNSFNATTAGMRLTDLSVSGDIDILISNGSQNAILFDLGSYTTDGELLIIFSWDGTSTSNNTRLWLNSTTKIENSLTLKTSTTSATTIFNVGNSNNNSSGIFDVGTRLYHFSCGNAFIDDADAALIFAHLEARNDRDYTPPWNLSQVTFNNTFDTSAQNTTSAGMFLRADGVKMFVIDFGTDTVFQYTLSTPGDVSTASFDTGKSFSVNSEDSSPQGVWFKNDGLIMYIAGSASGKIFQYTLSSAWDVSTASFASKELDTSAQSAPRDVFIKPDGTELYIAGPTGSSVYQYTLSTPHDVSTGTFTGSFDVTTQENSIVDVYFKDDDGTKMFIVGQTNDTVFQYTLLTPWLASTATFDGISFSVAGKSTTPQGLVFDSTGETFYITDSTNDIHAFDVGKI